ncbi:MAG TPA: hypothetical protein VJ837_05525 [Candidatus Paceibacterota bacterium]|nr:hypothetical protein [Candidatus Paceibacterota bacterium]
MRKRLSRFFDQVQWAEKMMHGSMRFRSLAYYRDYEEQAARGDGNEGTSVFRPDAGLPITKEKHQTAVWKETRAK